MPYCTIEDIENSITLVRLIELTDDEGTDTVDEARVMKAVNDADAVIDAYCGSRYKVPFVTVPDIIRKISVEIAIYNLYGRVSLDKEMPKTIQDRYNGVMSLLKNISKGLVSIGELPAPPEIEGAAEVRTTEKIFSRESLGGY